MVLASDSASVFWIAVGAFLGLCFLMYVFRRRDVSGRQRAVGCVLLLALFFAPFVGFLAVWANNHVF